MWIENQAAWVKQLVKLKTIYLDGGKLGLFTNNFNPTVTTVLADLVEATFDGYAQVTLTTFGAPFLDPGGNYADCVGPAATFTMSGTTVLETITGAFILDKDGVYMGATLFDAPVPLTSVGQSITIIPQKIAGRPAA